MTPVEAIVRKEWNETLQNRTLVWSFLGLGVMFMAFPLVFAFLIPLLGGGDAMADPDIAPIIGMLTNAAPGFEQLSGVQQFQVFAVRQFLPMQLLLPIMGALSIATYSIIGEKTSRSLEAVLATPTSTRDLLVGKSLAATLPAVLGAWFFFLLFALIVWVFAGAEVFRYGLDVTAWALMLIIAPLVAFMALGLAVIVSSRSTDPRSAQQIASLLVLPIVALFIGQMSGLFLLGLPLVLVGAAGLLILDVIILSVGVRLFQRETILTKWK